MEFWAGAAKGLELLGRAAPAAATIFKTGTDMYSLYKNIKTPKSTASGKNAQSEQLVQIKQEISELKGMVKDPSKSTLQCQEKLSDVDKKLDQMTLAASELKGMVKYELCELKSMMKDPSKSALQCQEKLSMVDKKLDEMSLEASELKRTVEDLVSTSNTEFERIAQAFSQVKYHTSYLRPD